MIIDDVIYFSSLILCISLGSFYKKIENTDMKRNYGAGLGILMACLICGHHIYHSILLIWGNIIIIKCCDKRYIHQISLAYTWTYLLYLHYNITSAVYVIWLHQTLALRLVGLAFEIYLSDKYKADPKSMVSTMKLPAGDTDICAPEPSAVDIITYAYFFIGLHKGPYYRWKIFNDHFNAPFGVLGDCRIITEQKLKKAFVCFIGYMILRTKYSPQFYCDNAFYESYGTDFRFLYNIPQLIIFFLQYQVLMMMSTSVCTETGFGVYPAKCQPIPGYGPSAHFSLLKLASGSPDIALEQEYNFAMLKCFENEKVLLGPTMKETMRGWDMPTQYWFWGYMYKNLVKANKEVRSACSFLAWTVWCGPSVKQIIVSSTLWIYVHLESEYQTLYQRNGSMKMPWDIGYSMMRAFCLIYLAPCLFIDDDSILFKYYNSIYWIYHLVLFALIIFALIVYKSREG